MKIKPKYSYMKNLIKLISFVFVAVSLLTSCEGPMGPAGKDGADGLAGVDANETCKLCHNSTTVDLISVQYQFSKHKYGEAAFEESGSTGCSPCHTQEAFRYVVKNNTPVAFTLAGGVYSNPYSASAGNTYGEFGCVTCHSSLHTTFAGTDFAPLTSVAAVPLTMWGGTKTVNLTHDGGKSNLCVKCHQPRPFVRTFGDKNVVDYAALANSANATLTFFDGNAPTSTANVNTIRPGYRTHTHYGTAGAMFAGVGGVEFGTGYTNSWHTANATCQDCHMAPITGRAGGHTFVAKGNFNGCNVTGCHSATPITSATTTAYWKATRDATKLKLDQLAAKLTIGGVDILNRNPTSSEGSYLIVDGKPVLAGVNLWAGITTNKYDGYLNIYDPATNPLGSTFNASMFQNPNPSTSWTVAQTAYNLTLPKITLTNAQMGAIINFQLVLRDYSLGIHNTKYTTTLLTNTIAALP